MFVQYGSLKHPKGQVKYSLRYDPILNAAEFAISQKARFELSGTLLSNKATTEACQADLAAQAAAVMQAYSLQGQDLLLVQDNGQPSPVSLFNANTLGGVRVIKPPEFPVGDGTQYVTQLDFSILIEAEIPFSGIAGALWSFEEGVDIEGDGGSEIGAIRALKGAVTIQTLHQQTEVIITQDGQAYGYLGRPAPMPPILPALQNHAPGATRIRKLPNKAIGRGKDRDYKLFGIAWHYTFLSPVLINAEPNVWPLND